MNVMIPQELQTQCVDYFKWLILDEIQDGFVAGGAVREWFSCKRCRSDVDVWFANAAQFNAAVANLGSPEFSTDYIANYRRRGIKIQLINSVYFESPASILDYFDFTIACGAVSRDAVVTHQRFFIDLCGRRLVIANMPHPRSTLTRVLKYERKGFRMCPKELNKLALAIHKMKQNEIEQPIFYVD